MPQPSPPPTRHTHTDTDTDTDTILRGWLALCCLLVAGMILLGGSVRLLGAGLSMVEWQPLIGAIPPLSPGGWQAVFADYQQYPEFQHNPSLTLAEFKFIFWLEYFHRLGGRILAVVFLLPLVFFGWRGRISLPLAGALGGVFVLGAIQGVVGWYMVQSGLVHEPSVSQYRLVVHLLIAVGIYGYLLHIVCGLSSTQTTRGPRPMMMPPKPWLGLATLVAVVMMIGSGGLVAGTRAGLIFATFPKMGEHWLPAQLLSLTPLWKNLFENPITIQFTHRLMAATVCGLIIAYAYQLYRHHTARARWLAGAMLLAIGVQLGLGIATLLAGVPWYLGVAHQGGALVVLSVVIVALGGRGGAPRLADRA